jgi:hypothetical protein
MAEKEGAGDDGDPGALNPGAGENLENFRNLCGVMAMQLREVANQLDADMIDCAMFMVVRKDRSVQYNLIDGQYFMSFESYLRNFINRFGREAVEKALFPDESS